MGLPPFLLQASELGIRLEIVNGLPIWEAQPVYRHQKHVEPIADSIENANNGLLGCSCTHALDINIS